MKKVSIFSSNLLAFRKKKNYSVMDLVRLTGFDKQSIYAWEDGKYEPSKDNLAILSKVLSVEIADFYRDQEKKQPDNLTTESLLKEVSNLKSEIIDLLKQLNECQKTKTA